MTRTFPILWEIQDYVDENKARLFFPGERIPYVVTAVVNGIEKIIKKDVYKVFGQDFIDGVSVGKNTTEDREFQEPVNRRDGSRIINTDGAVRPSSTQRFISELIPIGSTPETNKRVHFNIRLNVLNAQDIPLGLSEVRLYIANKNVQDRGLFNYVYPADVDVYAISGPDGFNGWVQCLVLKKVDTKVINFIQEKWKCQQKNDG